MNNENKESQTDIIWEEIKRKQRLEQIERDKAYQESLNNPSHDSNIEILKEEHKKLRMPWESSI